MLYAGSYLSGACGDRLCSGRLVRTTWRFFRAWIVARVTGSFPLPLWGCGDISPVLGCCALCGERLVGLKHLLAACAGTAQLRAEFPSPVLADVTGWCLDGTADTEELPLRVRYLGFCCSLLASAWRCRGAAVSASVSGAVPC